MLLRDALNNAVAYLERNAVGSPRMNAEVLLMFVLACDRAYLYAHPERTINTAEESRYREALAERARGVPLQYITGHQEFWGLDLIVSPAVLIPRPETEHVVETVLGLVAHSPAGLASRIVDIGTGSGCIALALASELPQADIWAVDLSPEALEVARANAARLQLSERIRFCESNLLGAVPPDVCFDFIVSNPPYVGEGEEDKVQHEVKKFEPRMAVFAGPHGLDMIQRLITETRKRLNPNGWLVMEMGYTQEQAVRDLLRGWTEIRITNDLQGIPRVIAAAR